MNVYPFLEAVHRQRPLVHHLTNWVTILDCAQVVKSFGASPVMAHAPEEAAEMTAMAAALVLNIGTLTQDFIASMQLSARAANEHHIPIVLDVCGAGATAFRDRMCLTLLEHAHIDIIKGNASEIARIAGHDVRTRGVDAMVITADLPAVAAALAAQRNCTVVITGRKDIIASPRERYTVRNGTDMMPHVVGTGCMAASVIGTFAGASPQDITAAAAAGLSCYGIAAELATLQSDGPASFKQHLLDTIFRLTPDNIAARQRVDP